MYRVTQKIPPHGNLNILAMPCWITTKLYMIAKEIIWRNWAKFHVYATCCSKVMALLLKKHDFHFYMSNFFFITGLNPGKIWRSIKWFMNWICMNHILICLLVIELASIKFATCSQRIVSLSLMKDNNISSDGCTGPQLSGQCIDRAQCTHLLI